jgi:hypothetical protein
MDSKGGRTMTEYPTIHISYSHGDQLAFRRYFTDLTPDAQKAVLDALDHLDLDGLLRGWDGSLIPEALAVNEFKR